MPGSQVPLRVQRGEAIFSNPAMGFPQAPETEERICTRENKTLNQCNSPTNAHT